tara:strand:- start:25776 stop:26204 length:429 start_codon:yes stop_codon:yes gene_type:complete
MKFKFVLLGIMATVGHAYAQDVCEPSSVDEILVESPEKGLSLDERTKVSKYGRMLAVHPEWRVEINVTTDSDLTETYNLHLAEKWGRQAENAMLVEGANASQIRVVPKGKSYYHVDKAVPSDALYITLMGELGEVIEIPCAQ